MNNDRYNIPLQVKLLRPGIRSIFRGLFHLLGKVKISGLDHIPKEGAYIIAFNHISLYDPPFVVSFWPCASEVVGAAEVWDRRGQGTLMNIYGVIPVHREDLDRSLITRMVTALRAGRPLAIAPEGGRSHQPGLMRAWSGVAYIAELTKVPVIPVGVIGSTEDFFANGIRGLRPPIEMRIGPQILLPPIEGKGATRRDARQKNADHIMAHIANLLPPNYRGVYKDYADLLIS